MERVKPPNPSNGYINMPHDDKFCHQFDEYANKQLYFASNDLEKAIDHEPKKPMVALRIIGVEEWAVHVIHICSIA